MARTTTRKRRPVIPELMGFAEVCETLGVRTGNLQFISDLPRPVASVRATQLWLADEILEFNSLYQERRDERAKRREDPGWAEGEEARAKDRARKRRERAAKPDKKRVPTFAGAARKKAA